MAVHRSAPVTSRRRSAPVCMHGPKKTLQVRLRCAFRRQAHFRRTLRPKKNHRGDLAGGGITSHSPLLGADTRRRHSAPTSGAGFSADGPEAQRCVKDIQQQVD